MKDWPCSTDTRMIYVSYPSSFLKGNAPIKSMALPRGGRIFKFRFDWGISCRADKFPNYRLNGDIVF